MVSTITFDLNGTKIVGDLYLPDALAFPCPAVVMAPGFGGVKEMLMPCYAEALAKAGIATLAIDYPNFGASGGKPRQFIDIKAQQQSYVRALDYLQQDERIDASKLGVWGSSLSGGHVLVIAARDKRVKSVMTLIPFIATPILMAPVFFGTTLKDLMVRTIGGKAKTIKIAGRPDEFAAMNTDGAWEWMQKMTVNAPSFKNEVTISSLLQMANYRTASAAKSIKIPLKVILATEDSITPASLVKKAVAGVRQLEIDEYPETHFELFDQYLLATVSSTVDWFKKTLNVRYSAEKSKADPVSMS